MEGEYTIEVKQVKEVVKTVRVSKTCYESYKQFELNVAEFFDNYPFEDLEGEIIEDDVQIFINTVAVEDITAEI